MGFSLDPIPQAASPAAVSNRRAVAVRNEDHGKSLHRQTMISVLIRDAIGPVLPVFVIDRYGWIGAAVLPLFCAMRRNSAVFLVYGTAGSGLGGAACETAVSVPVGAQAGSGTGVVFSVQGAHPTAHPWRVLTRGVSPLQAPQPLLAHFW